MGSDEVLVAMMASAGAPGIAFGQHNALDLDALRHRLNDEIGRLPPPLLYLACRAYRSSPIQSTALGGNSPAST